MSGWAGGYDETPSQRRRNLILGGVALGLAVVAAIAVVAFVLWRHDDDDPGADRVLDRLTNAINAHSVSDIRGVACDGLQDTFAQTVLSLGVQHAHKVAGTHVSGSQATGLLTLTVTQPQATPPTFQQMGYIELEKRDGNWCATDLYNAVAN